MFTAVEIFEEVFRETGTNAAQINAGATAYWRPSEKNKEKYASFNTLWFYNVDSTCTVRVLLDGDTNNAFDVPPSSQLFINAEDGQSYTFFDYKNTHGSSNIAATTLRFRVGASRTKAVLKPVS
jgi:hypothetical protein